MMIGCSVYNDLFYICCQYVGYCVKNLEMNGIVSCYIINQINLSYVLL